MISGLHGRRRRDHPRLAAALGRHRRRAAAQLLLNAIAAAVIGGTSLFGGHGRVVSALLGAAVIATVANGMDLLNLASGVKFVITGGVLLAAVLVDAFAKRARASSGVA